MQCKEGICAKAHNGSKEEKAEVKQPEAECTWHTHYYTFFIADNDLTQYTTDDTNDPLHYGKLIPDCYIQDGKKREWINMHESSQHEVYKSGIGGYLKTTYWNYATPC